MTTTKTTTIQLTENDRTLLATALRAGADQFITDAVGTEVRAPRVAAQFERQARDARRLASLIESATAVAVTVDADGL